MSVVLQMWEESTGGPAADTGNLVHAAAKAFHDAKGPDRVAEGVAALEAAREKFPLGDAKKATKVFHYYAADTENNAAVVRWNEQSVRLTLPAAPEDPTGEDVVLDGTLDQVRERAGVLSVWDIKTGDALDAYETIDEYAIQQAVYVLAARQTLHRDIVPGGVIWTPGYPKKKVHIPIVATVEQCMLLVAPLTHVVAQVRAGTTAFKPSASNCKYCPFKPWPACHARFRGVFGGRK